MANKVKKHPLISAITGALADRLPETVEEIGGAKYRLRIIKPEAEDWVAVNTAGATVASALLNARKPTLACALVSISYINEEDEETEIPVEQLFQPDDSVENREFLMAEPRLLRDWRRAAILDWLREEMDPLVIDQLYSAYSKLVTQYKEAMKEIRPLFEGTTSAA